ncbi:MAG: MGMT family protein [Bacteroidetes bacterium]|nr:MGMT family protein [Bacteroidota bacterium]
MAINKLKVKSQKAKGENEDFFLQVFQVVRLVPNGRVTSYGAIAKYLSSPKASRSVGYAMNVAHGQKPVVPAHRVVNRNGLLTGKHHFSPPSSMQEKLEAEGVKVKNDQVLNFEKVFWDPTLELAL